MTNEQRDTIGRLRMAAVGALAGLAVWVLVDVLPDRMEHLPRLYLFISAFAAVLFTGWLAMFGPLALFVAAGAALALAGPVAGLLTWASLRFDTLDPFFETGHPMVSFAILALIPLPFIISRLRLGRWADYAELFDQSWNIVVRYAAAWLFVGMVWAVLYLSDELLQLVGIDIIEQLIDIDMVPFVLTGATLGVGFAVVNELSDYVSPFLILRLLRLLVPAVLIVVSIFLLALPFRGLSNLFGDLSAAGTLLAMAMGAAILVTTALDASPERAVHTAVMRVSCQVLALLLPALAALAGWAIFLRVGQYGWTPNRLAAASLVVLVGGYGFLYALAVVRRGGWDVRIRRSNITMALVALGVAAIWLTPLFNPQKISTRSQVARYADDKIGAGRLDLWAIGREWGRAGEAGIAQIAAMTEHPQADAMAPLLAELEAADSKYAFERRQSGEGPDGIAFKLAQQITVMPQGATLPDNLLFVLRPWQLTDLGEACGRTTPNGNTGCVVVIADFATYRPGDEVSFT